MTMLSVNVNKVAVLRNSRGGSEPDVVQAASVAIDAGCRSITVHPRPDLRHIRPVDVLLLAKSIRGRAELNIEGNPFAPAHGEYPGLLALAEATRPAQITLVPDSDSQLTSDHGFDLVRDSERLRPLIAQFQALGARVSLFMDADSSSLSLAAEIGADRIEIYTGPFAAAFTAGAPHTALMSCRNTALLAQSFGLAVNAGHDLSLANLAVFLSTVPNVSEVSIGHALISEALYDGLANTVKSYLELLNFVCTNRSALTETWR